VSRLTRWLALAVSMAACTPGAVTATTTGPTITAAPPTTTTPLDQSAGPVAAPVRRDAAARSIYFVMTDRFENGDRTNDGGGLGSDPLVSGFLPDNRAYYEGGDLVGLTQRLPYIAGLGIGAIWITPPFTNRPVQGDGTIDGSTAGYHGYWQIDWDHIDPHLGTEDEMRRFVDAAHSLGISVYFDIVVNHTGDVITYADGSFAYVSQKAAPYLASDGTPFLLSDYAGSQDFPQLDAATSFPHVPVFASESDASIKSPAWLNDVTVYHNRGNSSFSGESSELGDFYGLDDLFTEQPRVVRGMIDLYSSVIDRYGIDGFRIDTMKHVDVGFWREFAPAIHEAAARAGHPDFFEFGEVFATDEILQSGYTNLGVDGTLDFILSDALDRYVAQAKGADALAQAFDTDDWFTDIDGNASMQVKFFGNHDMGRMGYLIDKVSPRPSDDIRLSRMELGFDLLFLTRGVPVVYYGDEQGFVGDGGDQLARQSMFPSVVPDYVADDDIGTDATPADENFDTSHTLYRWVADLNAFRDAHPAIVTGAQIPDRAEGPVFAFSRIDRAERVEYVVVSNNSKLMVPATFPVLSPDTVFEVVRGAVTTSTTSDADANLRVEIPPLSTVVLRASTPVPFPATAPTITLVRPQGQEIPTLRYRLEAELGDRRYAEVTFSVAVDGGEPYVVGTDDAPPYRVYWDTSAVPDGASVRVIATVDDGSGRLRSDVREVTMGVRS
jgi:glycosidase